MAAVTERTWAEFAGLVNQAVADPAGFRRLVGGSSADPVREFTATVAQRWPENRELELYSAPVAAADGEHTGRLFVFRDVTEDREIQRLKDEFASIVSHELRTSVKRCDRDDAAAPRHRAHPPKQSQYADALGQSATTLLILVDDILDFSKIEAGRLELENTTVDVPSLIDEVVEQFAPAARAKALDLVSLFDGQLPTRAHRRSGPAAAGTH